MPDSCTICSSCSGRPVRKLLDTLSYTGRGFICFSPGDRSAGFQCTESWLNLKEVCEVCSN